MLDKQIDQYEVKYPRNVKGLKENTYMADIQSVYDTVEQFAKFKEESTYITKEGGFHLHKWHSSAPFEVKSTSIKAKDEDPTYATDDIGTQSSEKKILEIPWNTNKDEVRISFAKCLEK